MSAYAAIERLLTDLTAAGLYVDAPLPDAAYAVDQSPRAVVQAKRRASQDYFTKIKDQRTRAILVVNVDREGLHDYIGPNSFAEIAVAFAEGREIYLLQSMPANYADELTAWGVHCLNGNLDRLMASFTTAPPYTAHPQT